MSTTPSADEPDEVERLHLLIRSGTTFLAKTSPIYDPHLWPPKRDSPLVRKSKQTRIREDTATLLASLRACPNGDFVAVECNSEGAHVWKIEDLEGVSDKERHPDGQKDHSMSGISDSLPMEDRLKDITLDNWIGATFNFESDDHTFLLSKFINASLSADASSPDTRRFSYKLECFIVFARLRQISSRFLATMDPSMMASEERVEGSMFIEMLTLRREGLDGPQTLRKQFGRHNSSDLLIHNCTGIEKDWKRIIRKVGPEEIPFDDTGRIALNKDNIAPFYWLISNLLSLLGRSLKDLEKYRYMEPYTLATSNEDSETAINEIQRAIREAHEYTSFFHDMAFHWRSFQHFIRHPAVIAFYANATKSFFENRGEGNGYLAQWQRIRDWAESVAEPVRAVRSLLRSLHGKEFEVKWIRVRKQLYSHSQIELQELIEAILECRFKKAIGNRPDAAVVTQNVLDWLRGQGLSWSTSFSNHSHPGSLLGCIKSLNEADLLEIKDAKTSPKVCEGLAFASRGLNACDWTFGSVPPGHCCLFCDLYLVAVQNHSMGLTPKPWNRTALRPERRTPWSPPPWERRLHVLQYVWEEIWNLVFSKLMRGEVSLWTKEEQTARDKEMEDIITGMRIPARME
ncbi:hypothetical protein BJ508DRAFT_378537 [Ascobolus immersus RN42]|uniref:Uncharacterized protein n=1 Tax=Ascobolus immersus RN42 TaxID=1160509 RepID=A0A3N4I1B8_ASCIM|nr:hypothetical protein BJ508DRAFT_378537 [Ascobolus immersus RN42]